MVKSFQGARVLLKRHELTKPRQASDLTEIYRKRYAEFEGLWVKCSLDPNEETLIALKL
jgi:hypothetical protein